MRLHQRKQTGRTMRTTIHLLAALMLCCSCFLADALAEEEDGKEAEDKVFELGEIVVTGKTPAAEGVTTVTERNQKDFQAWSDYSVANALQGIPGGQVTLAPGGLSGNGKQESLIRLRGFETTDVMIMIDGMPLTEPNMKRVDLSQIILDNVAKIKVIKGPSSMRRGQHRQPGGGRVPEQAGSAFRGLQELPGHRP
jgi:outer membrane cobalamin receptor